MRPPRIKLTVGRLMLAVALAASIVGAIIQGLRMKDRRTEALRIASLYRSYERSARLTASHYEAVAGDHGKVALEKRTEAQDARSEDLRKILGDSARDAEKRAERWSGLARPYQRQAEAYSRLGRTFEQAADRPWKPLPPIPEEWPLTIQ